MELEQTITVPLRVGDRITLYKDVDKDPGGFAAGTIFEGTVKTNNQQTGLIEFEDSNIGRAELYDLIERADGIQIV